MKGAISVSNGQLSTQLSAMTGKRQNKNVFITGNTVNTPGLAGLFLSQIENVQVCKNVFTSTNNLAYRNAGAGVYNIDPRYSILLYDTNNISFFGNSLTGSSLTLGAQFSTLSSSITNLPSDSCSYTNPTIPNMYADSSISPSPIFVYNFARKQIYLNFSELIFLTFVWSCSNF